jgi:peptidyl-prolyl cis-trans isomerase SurA
MVNILLQLVEKVKNQAGYTEYNFSKPALQACTDSLLDHTRLGIGSQIKKDAPLFKIGDTIYKVPDWIGYAQVFQYSNDGGKKPVDVLWEDFTQSNILLHYRNHLEKYNEDFRNQMNEFRDGNLFFEIMQREIWNISQTDSIALKNYYQKNKARYNWKPSADAVLFFCSDEETSKSAIELIKKNPADWRNAIVQFEEKVMPDSARYEWDQIPSKIKIAFTPGLITSPVLNKIDNTSSFAYIIKVYRNAAPRSFNEAKGLVINDYQQVLENKWVAGLKKKYPVTVNQKVLQSVLK